MTFIRRLMEIKERQLLLEEFRHTNLLYVCDRLDNILEILKVLKGGKDGKQKLRKR